MERPPNPVTESIDGATGDITMSGDAMRWSPELADGQARAVGSLAPGSLPGVDVAAGFGALLGLDAPGVRRLVSGAVTSLATVVPAATRWSRPESAVLPTAPPCTTRGHSHTDVGSRTA